MGNPDAKLRILLADDHQMFRELLRLLLDNEPDLEVVAEARDGLEVVRLARATTPDVICMDIGMPGMNGIDATRRLIAACPGVKVIAVSAYSDRHYVMDMMEAGAAGYVTKAEAGDELLRAIRAVQRKQTYLSPAIAGAVVDGIGDAREASARHRLGSRERQVLQLLAEGHTSVQIAELLHIAPGTVEVHRRNIMRKLDLHCVADLTRHAIRIGLVPG